MKIKYVAKDLTDLKTISTFVLNKLTPSKMVLLSGELGAGKTALIKQIAKDLNIKENITSPTFNYIKIYNGLVHIDAYNLNGDLSEFEDYFEDNLIAIEWAENIDLYVDNYLYINVKVLENNSREYIIKVRN
ncbi:tRNA (adenosine(37)-N6)-threonylcarbamoyltransferase complex ATPase subunit type 1 TsaE [Mycoplasma sp. 744]|uniref:tRNA (adenosine(37)-N6)-threonylcarbamoyltransferase complex ATPase subunit type 1 TsaE n=1 Tax=Mycoplasma sp. 744 TaxID=3108531 RepID=UPI002B1D2BED|nr:tRNA (adenosine(37)-N6)-threonylcarbamoyltransferase complex ATPase subunit type 1 TsaE [Mycoplasma sp. 744]MEA4115266.1 tRNA (adenosine(37)-N6)-threonylcarbamoyltransferase complex ATPase subunit type 1 TsaE [Mycoplasma sp. 744]